MNRRKLVRLLLMLALPLLFTGILWSVGLLIYQPSVILPLLPLMYLVWWLRRKCSLLLLPWIPVAACIVIYQCIPGPSPEAWQTPWAEAPQCSVEGDTLRIRKVRDFVYRSEQDYEVRYRDESYPLNELEGVDFAECHWDGMTAICHTMLSFRFADGRHLVVSAETRLPVGEEQNALGGLYKRYGILYVFGTEEDIFRLRTNYRHEDLSVYPLNVRKETARKLLLHYVTLANQAEAENEAYNTVTGNCSTGLVSAFRELAPQMPRKYDLLPIHNGSIAGLLYRSGAFLTRPGESEESLRRRCYVGYDIAPNERAAYSAALRERINRVTE